MYQVLVCIGPVSAFVLGDINMPTGVKALEHCKAVNNEANAQVQIQMP
jgi:hypothetical protein